MKKWNNGSFNRTKLATAVAVVSLGLMAGGCGSDGDRSVSTSTSTTAGGVTQITAPKGSVTGHVQDTNGNAIVGATVNVAGQSTTTDAQGQYYFEEVQVVGVTGADGPNAGGAVQVVVQAAGHLGATVTVTPLAQIDGTPGDSNGTVNQNVGNVNNNTVFVDGFLARAGTTVLPKLAATLTGHVRVGTSAAVANQALAGHVVSLDFAGVLNSAGQFQQQPTNGVAVSYAVPAAFTANTGTDGFFSIPNLPEDSAFNLIVRPPEAANGTFGYTVTGVTNAGDIVPNLNGAANTNAALVGINNDSEHYVGTVAVLPITSNDTVAPVVHSVDNVKNLFDTANRVPFNNPARPVGSMGVRTFDSIVVQFSEQMDEALLTSESVVVWNATSGVYEPVTSVAYGTPANTGGSRLTITFGRSFDQATREHLEVSLLVSEFTDMAGQLLDVGGGANTATPTANAPAGAGGNLANEISFDRIFDAPGACCTKYVKLDICTFLEPIQGAGSVTASQLALTQVTPTTPEEPIPAAHSGALNDVEDTRDLFGDGANIDQLNVTEANVRLDALASGVKDAAVNVNTDRALVTFTIPETDTAARYVVTAVDRTGGAPLIVRLATPGMTDTDNNQNDTSVTVSSPSTIPAGGVPVEILVGPGAIAGESIVTIQPLDGHNNGAAPATLTLVDNVEPTVILQSAHGLQSTVGASLVTPFGDGAEITSPGQTAQRTPDWRVNPGHFTEARSTDTSIALALENASSTGLVKTGTASSGAGGAPAAGDAITTVYDRTGYVDQGRTRSFTSAVSVSESLSSASLVLNGGTATISGQTVQNDVTQSVWVENGNQQNIPGDLIRFTANDLEMMAASHGAQLDAAGSVDLAGNVAAANAFATVVDNLPPLVTSAIFGADALTVGFNEAIMSVAGMRNLATAPRLHINYGAQTNGAGGTGATNTINLATAPVAPCAGPTLSADSQTLTIPTCFLQAQGFNYNTAFGVDGNAASPLGNYTETAYGLALTDNRHTSLVWSTVPDARGNTWQNVMPLDTSDPNPNFAACPEAVPVPATAQCLKWTGLGRDGGGAGNGQSPIFALIDGLGPFQVTTNNNGFRSTNNPNTSGEFNASFTHPFRVAAHTPAVTTRNAIGNGDNTVTQAECNAFFLYVAAGAAADFGAGSDCTVQFNDVSPVGNTSSGAANQGTSNNITVRFTLSAAINPNDEIRVRPVADAASFGGNGAIFESSLAADVVTLTVTAAE